VFRSCRRRPTEGDHRSSEGRVGLDIIQWR